MVRMTREQVERVARELLDTMTVSRAFVLLKSREVVEQAIVQALVEELERQKEREEAVRKRMASMRKTPARRSVEWEGLFLKLMEEEYLREGDV